MTLTYSQSTTTRKLSERRTCRNNPRRRSCGCALFWPRQARSFFPRRPQALAGQTQVAVAANFTAPAKDIAAAFKDKTGNEAALSFGASGQFYAQIQQGAPFQVFLSADADRPKAAVDAGLAVADSRFTYAIGKLVLWSKSLDVTKGDEALKANAFAKLSIANPKSAPYGAAAVEAMTKLGVYDAIQPKIVQGNSIAQAFEFARPTRCCRRWARTRRFRYLRCTPR